MKNIVTLDVTSSKTDNERTLEITSSDCTFKEGISADDVRIMGTSTNYVRTSADISEDELMKEQDSQENTSESDLNENVPESETKEIGSFSITWNQSDKITVTFDETDENISSYDVYIHKDGINEEKYASGFVAIQNTYEEKSYEVELQDNISLYEENPEIDIKHEDAVKIDSNISKDDIALSGNFSGMTVESVETDDNHTVVKLTGKPSGEGQGVITFPADKTDCGEFIVKVNIVDTMLSIDNTTLKYESGKLSFDIINHSSNFTKNDNSDLKIDNRKVTVMGYSEDGKTVTVSVDTDAEDIDSAIEELQKEKISANAESVESGLDSNGIFFVPEVSFVCKLKNYDLYSDYVESLWNIYISDGKVNKLDENNIVFWNEYKGSEIESLEKVSDNEYLMKIKTSTYPSVLSDKMLSGAMSIVNNQAVNVWGTTVSDIGADMTISVDNGGDIFDIGFDDLISDAKNILSVAKLFGFPSGPFEKILDFCGEYAEQADSVSAFAKYCLSFAGIIDEDESSSSKIYKELSNISEGIEKLQQQLTSIENMIQQNDIERRQSDDYKHYADYRTAWKSFYNGELKDMQDIMQKFQTYYDEYIITFMKNSGKSDTATGSINDGTLKIFLNSDGNVEVPSTENESYSLYYSETYLKKYVFKPEHFTDACVKYEKDGFDDPVNLIINDSSVEKSIEKFNKDNGTKIDKNDLRTAIETQAASYAISKIGASDIIKTYDDFYTTMTSNDIMYGNIVETYIKMLSYCYNFQSEAEDDILSMQNYLKLFTIRSSAFASYASWFSPSYKRKDNPIEKQYENMMSVLDKNYLHDVSRIYRFDGKKCRIEYYYDWSYILNDKIHAVCIPLELGFKSPGFVTKSESESDVLSQKDMQLIYNRYKDLYNRKFTTAATFSEYLQQRNIIVPSHAKYKDAWVALKFDYDDQIDESEQYRATDVVGKYFTMNQFYTIGDRFGNDNKASRKYISKKRSKYRVGYKLDDIMKPAEKSRIYALFNYREEHWYWQTSLTTQEYAWFEKEYDERQIIFMRGEVGMQTDVHENIKKTDYKWTVIEDN